MVLEQLGVYLTVPTSMSSGIEQLHTSRWFWDSWEYILPMYVLWYRAAAYTSRWFWDSWEYILPISSGIEQLRTSRWFWDSWEYILPISSDIEQLSTSRWF